MWGLSIIEKYKFGYENEKEPQRSSFKDFLVLRHVIIMNCGICEIVVVRKDNYIRPPCCRAGIVYVLEACATIERGGAYLEHLEQADNIPLDFNDFYDKRTA